MAEPTPISAVVITLDEERNLGRCLDSLAGVVEESVVLDAGSKDGTEPIARERGARFFTREWQGYSSAKNHANGLAEHEYVLSIDADEALSPELRESILKAKRDGLTGAYSFNRCTNYCGKWIRHGSWYPDVKLRLFPKTGARWVGDIHEGLRFDEEPAVTWLPGDLEHYSYYDFTEHRERADRYSALTARKMFEAGAAASPLRPVSAAVGRFVKMYILKLGFLDGYHGFKVAQISAQSNVFKYQELNRLHRESRA